MAPHPSYPPPPLPTVAPTRVPTVHSLPALSTQAPLLRFGFNADPYLDPYYATIAPAGAGSAKQVRGCASHA